MDALGRPRINFINLTLRNPTRNEETPVEEYGRKTNGRARKQRESKESQPTGLAHRACLPCGRKGNGPALRNKWN